VKRSNSVTVYVGGESVAFDAVFDTSVTPTVIKLTGGAAYTPDGSEMQAKGTGSERFYA